MLGYNSPPQGDGNSACRAKTIASKVIIHPRKGTETRISYGFNDELFVIIHPRKGTETQLADAFITVVLENVIIHPRKGTETLAQSDHA